MKSRKKDRTSVSQEVFKDKEILNKRPDDMSYEDYRVLRRIQTIVLKKLLSKPPLRRVAQVMPTKIGYNQHLPFKSVPITKPTEPVRPVNTPRKTT